MYHMFLCLPMFTPVLRSAVTLVSSISPNFQVDNFACIMHAVNSIHDNNTSICKLQFQSVLLHKHSDIEWT